MRWSQLLPRTFVAVFLSAAFPGPAVAASNNPSYDTIPERNLFGLRQPQPQAQPEAPAPTLPKIVLTGITTVLDTKRALLKGPALGSPPGAPDQSFILTEGQREDYLEVVSINEDAGSVSILNCGIPVVLTFDRDGPKLPPTSPPAAAPTNPSLAVAGIPTPAATSQPQLPMPPGMRQVPTRSYQPRSPTPNTLTVPTNLTPAQAGAPAPDGSYLPPTGYIHQPPQAIIGQPIAPVESQLSPEEQAALFEIQREIRDGQAAPVPPLPPTGLGVPRVYQGDVPVATPGTTPNRTPPILPQ